MKNFALIILFFLMKFSLSSQHAGDFTITDGSLIMTNSNSKGLLNITGQIGRNFNMSSYRPVQNELITRMGINYAIHGSNGQTQYAIIGSKKSPFIELNAENGSISLFGENGSGGNWRTSNSTSSLGISVDMNGMVGIGTSTPNAKLHLSEGDLLLQSESGSGYPILWLKDVSGANTLRLDYNSLIGAGQNNVVIRSDNTKSVVLNDAGGNVGIGSSEPLAKLTVKQIGSGWNDGIRVERDASNYLTLTEDIDDIRLKNWGTGDISFYTSTVEGMRIMNDGKVGIGTADPQSKLAVDGQIRATEVKVLANIGETPDYVFEEDYDLRSLEETKKYISINKHLPEIPSAAEFEKNGIDLGNMNMRLLKKIEELTLYQIQLLERLEKAEKKISKLEND